MDNEKPAQSVDAEEAATVPSSILNRIAPLLKGNYLISCAVIMVAVAEIFLYVENVRASMITHICVLIAISISSMWIDGDNVANSLQAISLLSILRILNFTMPIFSEMTLYLFVFIYAPLMIPVVLVIRHQKMSKQALGIHFRDIGKYLPLALIVAFVIAFGEYIIIDPGSMIPDLSLMSILKISIVMIFFVGFVEEIVFRSILQTRLSDSFGAVKGIVIASLLFGLMHSGYGTVYEILFTSFAGLLFGYMFYKTNSLPLVTLAHGSVNIMLFGMMPFLL